MLPALLVFGWGSSSHIKARGQEAHRHAHAWGGMMLAWGELELAQNCILRLCLKSERSQGYVAQSNRMIFDSHTVPQSLSLEISPHNGIASSMPVTFMHSTACIQPKEIDRDKWSRVQMILTPFHLMCMPQCHCHSGTVTLLTIWIFQSKEGHHHVQAYVFSYIWCSTEEKEIDFNAGGKNMEVLSLLICLLTVCIYGQQKIQLPSSRTLTIKCLPFYYTNSITLHQHPFSLSKISLFHLVLSWCYWVMWFESIKHLLHGLEWKSGMDTDQMYRTNCQEEGHQEVCSKPNHSGWWGQRKQEQAHKLITWGWRSLLGFTVWE